jgi:lysophospholipase L1-like esterase
MQTSATGHARRACLRPAALMIVALASAWPLSGAAAAPAPGMVEAPCPDSGPRPAELNARTDLELNAQEPDAAAAHRPFEPATQAWFAAQEEESRQDWASLCRFEKDDAALAHGPPVVAVFLGDSITENWLLADPALFSGGVVNRGISGQTSPQMLVRFEADVVALHPRVVHIMAGTNDLAGNTGPTSARQFQNNIVAMCDLARSHGIRVVLASIPPAALFPWRVGVRPAPQIRELNAWLRHYAAERKLVYVDYYAALAGPEGEMRADLTHDGVHPHRKGYALMRPLAQHAIRAALARR